jgi:hypothetical protein
MRLDGFIKAFGGKLKIESFELLIMENIERPS